MLVSAREQEEGSERASERAQKKKLDPLDRLSLSHSPFL